MKYLAFDIENANHFVSGSICSFGYALADEHFNLIDKRDIVINPCCRVFDKHCKLAYEKGEYKTQPNFARIYPTLKELLQSDDTLVLGHAIANDIRFLEQALKRYSLPAISFKYLCTQNLYREFAKEINSISIESAAVMLQLDGLTTHKAEDDAFVCLKLFEYILKQTDTPLPALLSSYKLIQGEYNEHMHIRQNGARQNKQRLFEDEARRYNAIMRALPRQERRSRPRFDIDRSLVNHDVDLARDVLKHMADSGAILFDEVNLLNVYITHDLSEPSARLRAALEHNEKGGNIKIICASEMDIPHQSYSADSQRIREFSKESLITKQV